MHKIIQVMRKFLSLIYFKIYELTRDDFNAVGLLTVLISLNIFTVIGYYETLVRHHGSVRTGTASEILIILSILVFVYINFSKGKNARIAYEEFKQKPIGGQKGSCITFIYILVTLILLTGLIWT
jgi:hypothetical protein